MLSAKGKACAKLHAVVLTGCAIGLGCAIGSASGAFAQTIRYTCLNDSGDKAITACNAILKGNSNDSEAYLSRGSEYGRKGEHDRAISDYNNALALISRLSNNDSPPVAARSSAASSNASRLEALERLGKLRNSGVLTKQEFEREKARILKE